MSAHEHSKVLRSTHEYGENGGISSQKCSSDHDITLLGAYERSRCQSVALSVHGYSWLLRNVHTLGNVALGSSSFLGSCSLLWLSLFLGMSSCFGLSSVFGCLHVWSHLDFSSILILGVILKDGVGGQ